MYGGRSYECLELHVQLAIHIHDVLLMIRDNFNVTAYTGENYMDVIREVFEGRSNQQRALDS
jgi:hypothetical protein